MKTGIFAFVLIWMIASAVMLAFLCVKVFSLQKQINLLTQGSDGASASESTEAAASGSFGDESYSMVSNDPDDAENLRGENDVMKVYLTFDDGPSDNTDRILDILDDYNVKATFFVVGREDDHSRQMYQRIVNEGHTIGMHSYSHKYSDIYSSVDAFSTDFDKISNLIYETTGVSPKYYRFPGGSSNKVSNTDMTDYIRFLNDRGITYFDWNVSSGDATSAAYTADQLVENVMTDVVKYKTSVVLMHDADSKTATVDALPKLIEQLQEQGALILPISEDTTPVQHVSLSAQ